MDRRCTYLPRPDASMAPKRLVRLSSLISNSSIKTWIVFIFGFMRFCVLYLNGCRV